MTDIVNQWEGEEDGWKFKITENSRGIFVPYWNSQGWWNDDYMWFPNYQGARNYLKREYFFNGRMKKAMS